MKNLSIIMENLRYGKWMKTYNEFFLFIALATMIALAVQIVLYKFYRQMFIGGTSYLMTGVTGSQDYAFDSTSGYKLRPNISDHNRSIFTDENGFRIESREMQTTQKMRKIIIVGDSCVFGWGVKGNQTYASRLNSSKALQELNLSIINAGVPSYSLLNLIARIEQLLLDEEFELMIVSVLWPYAPNDVIDGKIDFNAYRDLLSQRNQKQKFLSCHICRLFRDIFKRFKYKKFVNGKMTRPGVRDWNFSEDQESKLANYYAEMLIDLKNKFEAMGKRITFMIHPYSYTLFPPYENLGIIGHQIIVQKLNALDFRYKLGKILSSPNGYFIDGSHLTEQGHRLFAQIIQDEIISKNF
ncbi:hypothetical protein MCEBLUE5_00738 [Candidatus Planktophila versatilis]